MTATFKIVIAPILVTFAVGSSGALSRGAVDDAKDHEVPALIAKLAAHPDQSIIFYELAGWKFQAKSYFNLIAMHLSSPDPQVRRSMIIAMQWTQMPVEQVAPWAVGLLRRDPEEDVRIAATGVLEDLVCKEWKRKHPITREESADGHPIPLPIALDGRAKLSIVMRECLDAVVSVSIHDKSVKVRSYAAVTAIAINPGEKRVIPALVEAIKNKSYSNQKFAAITIFRSLDPSNKDVIQALCNDLSAKGKSERIIAIQDLHWLLGIGAIEYLQKALSDSDGEVRSKAQSSIDSLKEAQKEKK